MAEQGLDDSANGDEGRTAHYTAPTLPGTTCRPWGGSSAANPGGVPSLQMRSAPRCDPAGCTCTTNRGLGRRLVGGAQSLDLSPFIQDPTTWGDRPARGL